MVYSSLVNKILATRQERSSALAVLAGWCYRHRRAVVAAWLVAVAALIGVAVGLGSSFSDNYASPALPAQQAQNLLTAKFPSQAGATVDVVMQSAQPLTSGRNAATIGALVSSVRRLPRVSSVTSPLAASARDQLSANGRIGFAVVTFDTTDALLPGSATKDVIDKALDFARPGLKIALGGTPVDNVVTAAPGSSEGIGITAAVIIMLVAFGSVVAMGLPLLTALTGVGMGFGIVFAASHVLTVPTYGPDLMAMIGLGVGIDYSLLVVTRYRQELADGQAPLVATQTALSTAGRSVLFAGGTVVIALLGLLVINLPFMDGLATGTVLAVLMVLGGAVTLLPALLGFAGHAIDKLRIPGLAIRHGGAVHEGPGGFWLASHDNSAALAGGLAATARVITAAAIMVCVFASFVINDPLRVLNVFGLGLAFAVFIDATVVRMVLVPSIMQILGNANWWMPGWPRRRSFSLKDR